MRRVVITGRGITSPIGNDLESVAKALAEGISGIRYMEEWEKVKGLRSRVAGVVDGIEPKSIKRKYRRTMGRMAVLASLAAKDAVDDAGLGDGEIHSERAGVAMGSTTGSGQVLEKFFGDFISTGGVEQQEGTLFMKVMGHTVAANVAACIGTRGRLYAPCSACASSTQAIGTGYEFIRGGFQDIMVCGGGEDLHPITAGVFDIVHAASNRYNDTPAKTPRPFDAARDGLVVGEGGAAFVLEEYGRAKARGAKIHAEILGYATNCDGRHMTFPSREGMRLSLREALKSAEIPPDSVDYINAHATGTEVGDVAEAEALRDIFGENAPVSATKGYTGHTLAACGAMEAIFCLIMMEKGIIFPTLNLEEIDPACSGINHVQELTEAALKTVLTSNFAFGGVNATLVLGKV
ncbi:MAG: hypothetical protein E3J72_09975 [Planctomycetota bacterium]|nr:MAG: hypothetical protein E3J72_09975 [Planctomycetota bacterium]